MAGISDPYMPESISQKLSAETDVRTQCLRKTSNEVLDYCSVVMNFDWSGLGVRWLLLLQLLDLSPDALVGAKSLLEGTPL
jgi:hypothetical protein